MVTSSRSEDAHSFLEVVTPIWDSTMELPSRNAPVPSPSSARSSGKLLGRYIWPFSIPFPTEFSELSSKRRNGSQITYPTPQTLCQRGINANIQYEVTLKIITSGLFNSKHK